MSLKERLGLEQDPVFLVDGHAFLYRFFYANPGISRADGFPTNAVFMFVRMLFGLLRTESVRYAGFFFDGKGPTFRHELFTAYKAQRPPMPDDLRVQVDHVLRAIGLMGFKTITSQGVEADDCIAALAARLGARRPVVIVGADKDLRQCLTPRVVMWDPGARKDSVLTLEAFQADTGLTPAQWPDFQALIGDSADNIPGVPKVGPKTALRLMQDHPTLEALREAVTSGAGEFTPALRQRLAEHMDEAFLYRKLTTLDTTACPELDLDDLACAAPDATGMADFLAEFELRSLGRELPAVLALAAKAAPGASGAPGAPKARAKAAPEAGQQQGTLFDMAPARPQAEADIQEANAPTALPDAAGQVAGLLPEPGAAPGDDTFLVGLGGEELRTPGPVAALAAHLTPARAVATPDVKALLTRDPAWAALPEDRWFDLGLAAYLLSPEDRNYSWERLTGRLAPELLPAPAAGQACTAAALARALEGRLAAAGLDALMRDVETPLIGVLARMERRGVLVDKAALAAFLAEVSTELDALEARIKERAGVDFNLRSSQQMADVLFTRLGLKPRGKTPGGLPSTSFDVLEKLRHEHPVVADIQAWRKLEKMRSTYLEPLPRAAGPDGRIRTTFNQLATATGRLSSSSPNLQNIPIRGDMGRRMRACFVAPAGRLLVAADYSQVELRVLAHLSQEPALLEAFRHGQDIHARTAAILFDTEPARVTPDQRRNAKTINFGLIYGMGPQKLSGELEIPLSEAKAFIERYFERLPGLRDFYQAVEDDARNHGFVTTMAGRRRLLPHIDTQNQQDRALARRQAINTRVQGSAADIIKLAMLAVDRDPELAALDARLLLQVHDELLLECPEANAAAAGRRMADIMSGVMPLDVPLAVDWGQGPTWAEAH